jgi:hypothetical protein
VNQPNNESMNQRISEPLLNWPINESRSRSVISHSLNQWISKSTNQWLTLNQWNIEPMNHNENQWANESVWINESMWINQPINQSVNQSNQNQMKWHEIKSVEIKSSQSIKSINQSVNEPVNQWSKETCTTSALSCLPQLALL